MRAGLVGKVSDSKERLADTIPPCLKSVRSRCCGLWTLRYSNWKTYPQLYVKGELVGGLDLMKEMEDLQTRVLS